MDFRWLHDGGTYESLQVGTMCSLFCILHLHFQACNHLGAPTTCQNYHHASRGAVSIHTHSFVALTLSKVSFIFAEVKQSSHLQKAAMTSAHHLCCLLMVWHATLHNIMRGGHHEPEMHLWLCCLCNTLPISSRDSSPGTPTFGGGAQGSLLRDGSFPKDGSLYKDGSITSCLQAAFQAQLEEADQQQQVLCPFHCCFQRARVI